jgi:hypothetical protein
LYCCCSGGLCSGGFGERVGFAELVEKEPEIPLQLTELIHRLEWRLSPPRLL